jgi:acyl CoA:acetate/3-ketoacid CoA transferase beta subunit
VQGVAVAIGHVQQADHSGLPLDQGADRRALVLADDQITFPMAGLGTVIGLERPLADSEHGLLGPGPAPLGALMRAAVIPAGAQRRPMVRRQR